jgi:1-phosphofructokinase family hexose kinase
VIYCLTCNPALDAIYSIDEFNSGRTYRGVSARAIPAGKGINVAQAIHTLGEETVAVGLMPEESRLLYEKYFDRSNIRHVFFNVPGFVRVNVTIHESTAGEVTHITGPGEKLPTGMQDDFQQFLEQYMHSGDLWAISGSLPEGFEKTCYQKVIASLKRNKIECLLDSSDNALKFGVRAKPVMVKPNLVELESFFGEKIKGIRHIALRGKRLLDMGIEFVFISLGSDGMIALHGSDCLLCNAPSVKAVDTVGCGDALVAGLMVARKRKFSFTEMCRMAVACGVSNALHPGAGMIDQDEVWRFMEEVSIEAV